MKKAIYKVSRQVEEEITLKAGNNVAFTVENGFADRSGKVTYIFDEGKQAIIDDEKVINTLQIIVINGKRI